MRLTPVLDLYVFLVDHVCIDVHDLSQLLLGADASTGEEPQEHHGQRQRTAAGHCLEHLRKGHPDGNSRGDTPRRSDKALISSSIGPVCVLWMMASIFSGASRPSHFARRASQRSMAMCADGLPFRTPGTNALIAASTSRMSRFRAKAGSGRDCLLIASLSSSC